MDRFALAEEPKLVETQNATAGQGRLTSVAPLLARQTLLCGSDDGRLLGWMISRADAEAADQPVDGYSLNLAHEIKIGEAAIQSIASGAQSHVAVTSDDDNGIALTYVTTDSLLSKRNADVDVDIESVGLDPSGEFLIAAGDSTIALTRAGVAYPEASLKGFFGQVWYEGHDEPKFIWQSTAGTEASEIKLSLMPLIFWNVQGDSVRHVDQRPVGRPGRDLYQRGSCPFR